MKVIKSAYKKRTRYLLLDRKEINHCYTVVKHQQNCLIVELFKSTNLATASNYYDNLFK